MLQEQLSFFTTESVHVAPVKMIEIQEIMKIRNRILEELDYKFKISLDDFKDQKDEYIKSVEKTKEVKADDGN